MDFKIIFVNPMTVVINLLLLSTVTDAICILPEELRNTEWIYKYTKPDDNTPVSTTLRFQNTVLPTQSSIRLNALGTTMDAWTCISNLTLSDTESVAVFKSDTSYTDGPFSGNRWLYFCMKFTKVTDNLFYFYLLSDVDNTILPNERVFNPPENSIPDDSDPLCSTFCQYTSEPKIRTLQKTGTTDVVPSDAALCTPCESPCEEQVIACPDLAPVNFTTITAETGTNYQDNITYACNTGYELKSGDLIRECLADESWSGSPPVCEIVACPDLAPVNFATITDETGKNYQGTITYACNTGYELKSGDLIRECLADESWSGSPPVCEIVACPDLAPVNFATITAETGKNYQGTITYACNTGYELKSGDLIRECLADESWSGSPPVCEIVACPDLAPVNFATITAETGKNYQGTITYACNTGYELKSGDLIRECLADESWSGSPPVCEIVACPDLAPVNFATITAETGKNYQGTITYACNTGYELKSGDLIRECLADESWSGSPPVCEIVACPDLAPVNFATITAETGKNYQGTITYACNTGYELKSGDLIRECLADESWSGSPPVCEIVACPDLAPVNFATITAETGKNYQGTITYACNTGYELKSGDLIRECLADESWSGSPPVCEIVACPDLAPVNFATITAETGKNYQGTITYACNTGYELKSGDLIRECLADESWSGSPPVCEVVACPDLAPVNFATITAETGKNYQDRITYACNTGYELKSGDRTRQCQDDKAWSGSPPVCEVVACPDLAPVNFATITAETGKNYQDRITYACNTGYELKSSDLTRQCQDDKAWSGSPPVCEVIACPDLAPVHFATITAETGKNYQDRITYACNTGYELKSGDLTRQCQDDKAWSGSPPVCEAVACPDLRIAPINFATITAETGKNYQGTITYACTIGFELKSGDLTRQCQYDKTWSGSPPVCEAVACPDLRIAPINFATITAETGTSYQDTITYACNTGYKLKSGNLTRECLADGSWSGGPPVCGRIIKPAKCQGRRRRRWI
ncbi:CUB and sushi domain-containing protein 2-like isoform X2 [Mytilus edulis]|uniref:CUB and sushi domain-containing protein 2-like isoform X2 n=1 Tax=Mytilus edulis TaxID=6550 RepID=UPI0039EEF222